jgi:hypothetical protein
MTLLETGAVMDLLTVAYPKFGRGLTKDMQIKTAELWASMFAEDDVQIVLAAIKALIATKTDDWPPAIGLIKEFILKLTQPQQMGETEAWALINKAIKNYSFYDKPENNPYYKLPTVLQRVVGSPEHIKEWGLLPEDEVQTVVASNVMRSYRAKAKQEHEIAMIPESVKLFIGQGPGLKRIGGGD